MIQVAIASDTRKNIKVTEKLMPTCISDFSKKLQRNPLIRCRNGYMGSRHSRACSTVHPEGLHRTVQPLGLQQRLWHILFFGHLASYVDLRQSRHARPPSVLPRCSSIAVACVNAYGREGYLEPDDYARPRVTVRASLVAVRPETGLPQASVWVRGET